MSPCHRVPGPDPGLSTATPACMRGPAAGGRPLLDAAHRARSLLHHAQLVARWGEAPSRVGRSLPLSAPPDPPRVSVAEKPAMSQLPTTLDHSEPGRDSEPPRPLLQLRRPQHGGTHRGSASGPMPEPPEAVPRRGAGSAQLGLQSMAAASLGWAPPGSHYH